MNVAGADGLELYSVVLSVDQSKEASPEEQEPSGIVLYDVQKVPRRLRICKIEFVKVPEHQHDPSVIRNLDIPEIIVERVQIGPRSGLKTECPPD